MQRELLKSKIHRAHVTRTDKDYEGSLTVDRELLAAADIAEYEKVHVANITNGRRFTTYAIPGQANELCLNGAAARLGEVGDVIIVMSYALFDDAESSKPTVVSVDDDNEIVAVD